MPCLGVIVAINFKKGVTIGVLQKPERPSASGLGLEAASSYPLEPTCKEPHKTTTKQKHKSEKMR